MILRQELKKIYNTTNSMVIFLLSFLTLLLSATFQFASARNVEPLSPRGLPWKEKWERQHFKGCTRMQKVLTLDELH